MSDEKLNMIYAKLLDIENKLEIQENQMQMIKIENEIKDKLIDMEIERRNQGPKEIK